MDPNALGILTFDTPEQAPDYKGGSATAADLHTAVVVGNGTKNGEPTVDLLFTDEKGGQHVTMLTGRLLEQLAGVIDAVRKRAV